MNDFILSYIETVFSPELQSEIRRSMSLFEFFEYNQALEDMPDIFAMESYVTSDDLRDTFFLKIHEKLDYLLESHKVSLAPEVTISDKNEILTGLGRLQHREDYSSIIGILESFTPKEIAFSRILEEVTEFDQTYIMSILMDVDEETLNLLKEFIYQKEESEGEVDTDEDDDLKDIFTSFIYLFKDTSLGIQLIRANSAIGAKFETYLQYLEGDIVEEGDDEATALNIYSLLLLSSDGREHPIDIYREYSLAIFNDPTKVAKVEAILLSKVAKFNDYMSTVKETKGANKS